jgi:hypothetical protein
MKKIIPFVLILVLLAITTPAAAASKVPVGDAINIYYDGSETFAAGAPFHISHGFALDSGSAYIGAYEFQLDVDGSPQEPSYSTRSLAGGQLTLLWVFNFPDGMTGSHTFTGHWLEPCQTAVDEGNYTGTCSRPNAQVETRTTTYDVSFE